MVTSLIDGADAVGRLMHEDCRARKAIFKYASGGYSGFFAGYDLNEKNIGPAIGRVKQLMVCDLTAYKAVYNYAVSARPEFFEEDE